MLQFKRFTFNPVEENTYVLWDSDNREAAVIDCGAFDPYEQEQLEHFIQENNLRPTLSLLTHMHFDHIFGLGWLNRKYNIRPICHELEQENYDTQERMALEMFGVKIPIEHPAVMRYVKDGDELTLGNHTLKVIHTPGHTAGGVCYLANSLLFCGDTLFAGSCGRTDLPGGNMQQEVQSIREKLLTLPDEIRVLPGHGPETNIARERVYW